MKINELLLEFKFQQPKVEKAVSDARAASIHNGYAEIENPSSAEIDELRLASEIFPLKLEGKGNSLFIVWHEFASGVRAPRKYADQ